MFESVFASRFSSCAGCVGHRLASQPSYFIETGSEDFLQQLLYFAPPPGVLFGGVGLRALQGGVHESDGVAFVFGDLQGRKMIERGDGEMGQTQILLQGSFLLFVAAGKRRRLLVVGDGFRRDRRFRRWAPNY